MEGVANLRTRVHGLACVGSTVNARFSAGVSYNASLVDLDRLLLSGVENEAPNALRHTNHTTHTLCLSHEHAYHSYTTQIFGQESTTIMSLIISGDARSRARRK